MRAWLVASCGALVACGGESAGVDAMAPADAAIDADEGVGERVVASVVGVRDPMKLVLRAGDEQIMRVTEDGTFNFPRRVAAGTAVEVEPIGQRCEPQVHTGTVDASLPAFAFTCDRVTDLLGLSSSIPLRLQPAFDPGIDQYTAVAPLVREPSDTTTLAAIAASTLSTITIAPGAQVSLSSPAITVEVAQGALPRRTYSLALSRDLLAEAYGKLGAPAPNAHAGGAPTDNLLVGASGVAISGDTLVVGAPGAVTAAIYERAGFAWKLRASFTGPAGSDFGASVAISGDTIVVGAPRDGSGSARVFRRTNGTWAPLVTLTAPNTTRLFGASVAIDGMLLAAGAPQEATLDGAVYIFRDDAVQGWTLEQRLASAAADGRFGAAIALAGAAIAIGAPSEGATGNGAAYVFERSGTTWTATPRIAGTAASNSAFGSAIGFDGTIVAVGSPFDGASSTGAVRTYTKQGAGYALRQTLVAGTSERFGAAVALRAGHLVVGAPSNDNLPTVVNRGAAYFFRCVATGTCTQERQIIATSPSSNDELGTAVAIDGDTIAVTAPNEDSSATGVDGIANESASDSGAVYVFR